MSAELQHLSLLVYAIPGARAEAVVPNSFQVEKSCLMGREVAWLSILSFLDQGSRHGGHRISELTSYRLHVLREGKPGYLLLGISLGSLSAVAARNLWPVPWHLSAMEFHVAYDRDEGRYRDYRLQTQSHWANASWEISDSGKSLLPDHVGSQPLLHSLFGNISHNYFLGRNGSLGLSRIRYHNLAFTSGKLKHAQSDLLERLGLVRRDELTNPILVALQHRVSCQIFSPTILGYTTAQPPFGKLAWHQPI
jgi:hypothetical protein